MRMSEEEYMKLMAKRGGANPEAPKKPKYKNRRVRVDGILFDSQLEADYYSDLKMLLMAGEIRGFCRQPEFILLEGFASQRPETYIADFIVFHQDGSAEVIDTKGIETEVFQIKKKQFSSKFPELKIKIIKREGQNHEKYFDGLE